MFLFKNHNRQLQKNAAAFWIKQKDYPVENLIFGSGNQIA